MLLENTDCILLIIDLQEKLLKKIKKRNTLIRNTIKLIKTFQIFGLPIIVTEQYPKGLGLTDKKIKSSFDKFLPIEKTSFSCMRQTNVYKKIQSYEKKQLIICGIESHICVLQTAFDLVNLDFFPYIVTDAVSTIKEENNFSAMQRLQQQKNTSLVTTEMVIFELLKNSKNPHFKSINNFLKVKQNNTS